MSNTNPSRLHEFVKLMNVKLENRDKTLKEIEKTHLYKIKERFKTGGGIKLSR